MRSYTPETLLDALRARGATRLRRVVVRENRTRLLSLSRDRRTLNAHVCFLGATPRVVEALATFAAAGARTEEHHQAVARLRAWPGAVDGLRKARRKAARAAARKVARRPAGASVLALPTGPSCGTPLQREFLRRLYDRLNATRFRGALPAVHLRLSPRMSRRYGHVRYDERGGRRRIVELALNVDLLMEGNEPELVDTMLHEMAHVEAWLRHGEKGHGEIWQRISERVGADTTASSSRRIRLRRRGTPPPEDIPLLLDATTRRAVAARTGR